MYMDIYTYTFVPENIQTYIYTYTYLYISDGPSRPSLLAKKYLNHKQIYFFP